MIFGLPLDLLLMRATALVVVLAVEGWAVAFACDRLGDPAARRERRLTANALRHLDPIGAPALALTGGFGWARQIVIDPRRLRFGRLSVVLVVLAGTVASAAVALLAALLRLPIADDQGGIVADTLQSISSTAVTFALFNLLPLPPLLGGVLLALPAPSLYRWFAERALFPALLIVFFLLFGAIQDWLDPIVLKLLAILPG